MKSSLAISAILALFASVATAHGPEHLSEYGMMVKRAHIDAAAKCSNSATFSSALADARMRKLKLAKRDWSPRYSTIQNTTCVLNPEVTEGPYWISHEVVRQNITDDEPGIPLYLDLGLLDVTTCTPISNAVIEIWHCNSTGYYSGYTTVSSSPGSTTSGHSALTDSLNFFRGAYPTNSNGLVEFYTKFPGYYTGRTTHIHLKVTLNPTRHSNGTYSGGTTVHIGQIFFDTAIKTSVFALSPYATGRNDAETTNAADSIFQEESRNGNNPIISLTNLGSAITDGFLGYITLGVNPSFSASASDAPIFAGPIENASTGVVSNTTSNSTSSTRTSTSTPTSSSGSSSGTGTSGAHRMTSSTVVSSFAVLLAVLLCFTA